MSRVTSSLLDYGNSFPRMEFDQVDGPGIIVPDPAGESWIVLLIYRGHW